MSDWKSEDPPIEARARAAIVALKPFGFFAHIDLSDPLSIRRHIEAGELGDYEYEDIEWMSDAEFDKLLLDDDVTTVTFSSEYRAERGELARLIENCSRLAGTAMPAALIEEWETEHGLGVRWRAHGELFEFQAEGKYWSPASALNKSVRGDRRFYEGPADPFWYLCWLTEEERAGLIAARGWSLHD